MRLAVVFAVLLAALAPAESAWADPSGRIAAGGVLPFSGLLDAEIGDSRFPLVLGLQASTLTNGAAWATVSGRYAVGTWSGGSWGVLLGLNQTYVAPTQVPAWQEFVHAGFGGALGYEPMKLIGGLYYEQRWELIRLRLAPSLSFLSPLSGAFRHPPIKLVEAGLIGPAWVEVGYRVTPSFELGLRSNLTPLVASWWF